MKQIQELYRAAYTGENIVTDLTYVGKQWSASQEWIGNSVVNNQISNQACIIGNGISRKKFDINAVFNHFGGILGTLKLQTYGCNALYRDYTPDFLVVSGEINGIVKEVAESGYCNDHIVYASALQIQEYPGQFYLAPQDLGWNSGSLATYIAAFDGHTKIFMIGFDGQDTIGSNYNMYAGTPGYEGADHAHAFSQFFDVTMKDIYDTYSKVDFVRVMPSRNSTIPESWKYCLNFRQIDFNDFILEADL
jgi:hypothetical protein